MIEIKDDAMPRNGEGVYSDTGCPMCDAGHPARQQVRTYGEYKVDGPPIMLEPGVEYRVERTRYAGEAVLKHPNGHAVAQLVHRDMAEWARRSADEICAVEDDVILDQLHGKADYRDIELRALAHASLDATVHIQREHPDMDTLLRPGILGAAAGLAAMYRATNRPRAREPLGGWNPPMGRLRSAPPETPARSAKRARRRAQNAARARTKQGR